MSIRALALSLFLAQVIVAEQPTPILPDPKLTPGDWEASTFGEAGKDFVCGNFARWPAE